MQQKDPKFVDQNLWTKVWGPKFVDQSLGTKICGPNFGDQNLLKGPKFGDQKDQNLWLTTHRFGHGLPQSGLPSQFGLN